MSCLLLLPVIAGALGHPSREQAYAGMSGESGPLGANIREIFHDPASADILFLGSSLLRAGIDLPMTEQGLTAHLGRPTHVETLALNWQGMDMQYFLLRDYLQTHHPSFIIWNLPVPGSRAIVPHVQAFRFMRFGEYSEALAGLPLQYRLSLYGEMILGSPRELLSWVRPNLLSKSESEELIHSPAVGYYGAKFIPLSPAVPPLDTGVTYEPQPWPSIVVTGPAFNSYEEHFAEEIVQLAKQKGIPLAFIHFPIDGERGMSTMPERGKLPLLQAGSAMIGAPSSAAFEGVGDADFLKYYMDQHLNRNGSVLYTERVLPAILKSYDTAVLHEQ